MDIGLEFLKKEIDKKRKMIKIAEKIAEKIFKDRKIL